MPQFHVLIAEDDDQLSKMYQQILHREGFRTLLVPTAREAVEALETFDPDVICLDWQLMDRDCQPILAMLRQTDPARRPQLMFISAQMTPSEFEQQRDIAHAYLQKPFSLRDLVKEVKALAEVGRERLKIQDVNIEVITSQVIQVTLKGRLTPRLFQSTLKEMVLNAEILIYDMRYLELEKTASQGAEGFPQLFAPKLQHVFLVHQHDSQTLAQYLARFLPEQLHYHYQTSLEEAIHHALALSS